MAKGPVPKVTKEQLIQDFNNGLTREEIAERYGLSFRTVKKYMCDLGFNVTTCGAKKKIIFDYDDVKKMYTDGIDKNVIASKYNTTRSNLNKFLRESGITEPRRKVSSDEHLEADLVNAKFADPPKKPFRDVVKGQRVIDVSSLYGL